MAESFKGAILKGEGGPPTLHIEFTTNDFPTLAAEAAGTITDTAALDDFASLTGMLDGADVDLPAQTLTYALAPLIR